MGRFRCEDREIRKMAITIADELDKKRLYRFSKQLRAAGMSMSKNIAEG